jgi:probable rRNA maturation factor
MVNIENRSGSEIGSDIVHTIAESFGDREVELILCDDREIRELNRRYRGIDRATDVLSFPTEGELSVLPLGSIVISLDKVKEKAAEYGHSQEDELALLFIHGMLHLAGYDHESDDGEMRARERELIEEFGLPESLIVRNGG